MAGDLDNAQWTTEVSGKPQRMFVRKVRLKVTAGPDKGLSHDFEVSQIRVGGRRIADLVLSDSKVSGLHFEVTLDERGYRLTDLQSTNGTFINSMRIVQIYLSAGAIISAGDSQICFEPLADSVEIALAPEDRCVSMVGRSPAMRAVFARVRKLSAMDVTVLITGETGTGKELVAEALHELSPRAQEPFIVVDCGSIAPTLIESELFGHERGAFTGATAQHVGAFERARGGTLFLDEIGELTVDLQPRLLRVLERKEIRRLGGTVTVKTDVRIVAATNRDLALEVSRGRFREDLFYRLAVAHVHMPPLREHREDIGLLVQHIAQLQGGRDNVFSPESLELLMRHDWSGNVRELRNVVERALALGSTPTHPDSLLQAGAKSEDRSAATRLATPVQGAGFWVPIDLAVAYKTAKQNMTEDFERRFIQTLLAAHGGNISAAARAAGIDRMTIHKILSRMSANEATSKPS